jgi:hypothetical protein
METRITKLIRQFFTLAHHMVSANLMEMTT